MDGGAALELEHAIGYSSMCGTLCWHPNGKKVVYAAGAAVVVGDLTDPHDQGFMRGHDANVTCLALSPSGRMVASGQGGKRADCCVWDFGSRELMFRLAEHDHGVAACGFSHDDKLLATAGVAADNKVLVWDMSNGYIVAIGACVPSPCTHLVWGGFVRDVKRRDTAHYQFATAGDQKLAMWSLDPFMGEMSAEKIAAEGRGGTRRDFTALCFSSDYETLYAGTTSGDFMVARVKTRSIVTCVPACRQGIKSLAAWPGGILVGGGDGSVTALDGGSLHDTAAVALSGPVTSLSFSPDGVEVAAGTGTGFIYRLRSGTLQSLLVAENHSAPLVACAFAADASDRFATLAADATIKVWDAADYSALVSVAVKDGGAPLSLAFTLDFLITGWGDGVIRAHDAEGGGALWRIDSAHRGGVTALALSHNERFVLSGGQEGEVRVWELRSRELVSHLKEHSGRCSGLALYDDDVHALSVGRDRALLCWDLRSERRVTSHVQRMGGMNGVALTKDQTLVATVGQERRVTLWDLRDHACVQSAELSPPEGGAEGGEEDEAMAVCVSGDGKWVATGGTAQRLKIFDARTLRLVANERGHSGTIVGLKFSPDGKQLVSVGLDGVVLVWNLYA